MTFRVWQKVVCVDASGVTYFLTEGSIYTVTSIRDEFLRVDCAPGARSPWGDEESRRGFYAHRFRPIVERKTDISVFKAMLTPIRQK